MDICIDIPEVKLILPPNYLDKIDVPLIFLAGPIQGAPDWHSEAIRHIYRVDPDMHSIA